MISISFYHIVNNFINKIYHLFVFLGYTAQLVSPIHLLFISLSILPMLFITYSVIFAFTNQEHAHTITHSSYTSTNNNIVRISNQEIAILDKKEEIECIPQNSFNKEIVEIDNSLSTRESTSETHTRSESWDTIISADDEQDVIPYSEIFKDTTTIESKNSSLSTNCSDIYTNILEDELIKQYINNDEYYETIITQTSRKLVPKNSSNSNPSVVYNEYRFDNGNTTVERTRTKRILRSRRSRILRSRPSKIKQEEFSELTPQALRNVKERIGILAITPEKTREIAFDSNSTCDSMTSKSRSSYTEQDFSGITKKLTF